MATGTVMWFDTARGFGYISPDDGGKDVFLHHRAISGPVSEGFRSVTPGARVEYDADVSERGPVAVRVKPVV